jgi:hypothetical protein
MPSPRRAAAWSPSSSSPEPRSRRLRSENSGFISVYFFSLYYSPNFGAIAFVPRELFLEAKVGRWRIDRSAALMAR